MKIFIPPVVEKIHRKLRGLILRPQLKHYLEKMSDENPLKGLPARIVGDAYADPTEFFTHYDAYAYWVAKQLSKDRKRHKILDLGSPKMFNSMLSASHDVTAIVLSDCSDSFSNTTYVRHDVSDPLPFSDDSFDYLTSTVALPLIGLGRYGDKVDPDCLLKFLREASRVMKEDAQLFVSMCLGPNFLAYNNGWYLDIDTIQQVFSEGGWDIVEATVDRALSRRDIKNISIENRFTSPAKIEEIKLGDYRVVFCQFRQKNITPCSPSQLTEEGR